MGTIMPPADRVQPLSLAALVKPTLASSVCGKATIDRQGDADHETCS